MRTIHVLLLVGLAGAAANWDKVEAWFRPVTPIGTNGAEVAIYTTRSCRFCAEALRFLDREGIPYTNRDIERSPEASRQFQALGGRGVPLIVVGDQVIHGFSAEGLRRALN